MTIPSLPPSGSTDWYAHYAALDDSARTVQSSLQQQNETVGGVEDRVSSLEAAPRVHILNPGQSVEGLPPGLIFRRQ